MPPTPDLMEPPEPIRVVDPELVSEPDRKTRLKAARALGAMGALLALLTMAAAAGFGFLALFWAPLLAAALSTLLWPLIFSPQFTEWIFGSPRIDFWKLFLLFLAAQAAGRLFRRQSWQKK